MTDTFRPPEGAATAAKRALRWIKEGHAGGGFTDVGRKRAAQLAARESLTLETVKRMYSYFSRHEVDKKGKDFDNLAKPSPGRVAWDAWGGDAGYSWAKRITEANQDKGILSMDTALFARIVKSDKQPDGSLFVTGIATDSSVDGDEQICDGDWLKAAMPSWFRWGNIREQHSNIAAGVATEYEDRGGEHWITAHVVDPASVKKVESGVLKGFSIGIRGARVAKDDKAAGGRIIDGEIVEVSLVDRPANPVCTLSLAKSVNGVLQAVEDLKEGFPMEDIAKAAEEVTSEESTEETTEGSMAPKAMEESSQKPGEESSQKLGEESSRPGGVAGIAGKEDGDYGMKMCKACGSKMDIVHGMIADIHKALVGASDAEKSQSEDIHKSINDVVERVSVLEKTATTVNAPARMAVEQPAEKENLALAKAREYRTKALNTTSPVLAQGYMALAMELEKSL